MMRVANWDNNFKMGEFVDGRKWNDNVMTDSRLIQQTANDTVWAEATTVFPENATAW